MDRDNICSRHCLQILHTVSEVMPQKNIVQLVSTSTSWCRPGVQSSLGLLKRCVGDEKSIPFTKVNKHYISLISPSKSMLSRNVSILLISNHTLSLSHYDGVCHLFRPLQNLLYYIVQLFHFVIFILRCCHTHLH